MKSYLEVDQQDRNKPRMSLNGIIDNLERIQKDKRTIDVESFEDFSGKNSYFGKEE